MPDCVTAKRQRDTLLCFFFVCVVCVCMCVCVCVCVLCVCVSVCVLCVCVCVCVFVCVVCVCVCLYVCCVCVCCVCVCMYACVLCVCMYACMCVRACVHMCMCACVVCMQARSQGGSGGSIESPILGSVCCACANMLPLLITTSRTYTLGASAAAQPCLTVELAEFPQIIKLAMSLGQGKAYTRPYFFRTTRACADAVRPAELHCSILCIRELCLPPNLKRYDWSGFGGR